MLLFTFAALLNFRYNNIMKYKVLLSAVILLFSNFILRAQGVAINSNGNAADSSAMLDVNSSSQGVLVPRMTAAQKRQINNPANGLLIYQTDSTIGFYFYNGTQWNALNSSTSSESASEFSYWQTQAALLDPSAYVLYSATGNSGMTITVPAGQTWYSLSQYQTHGSGYHQRAANVNQVIALAPGTTFTPNQSFYLYVCEPALVIATDSRYTIDPKGLYYNRLRELDTLPIYYAQTILLATMAVNATLTVNFPSGFNKGMIVAASCYDAAWGGMRYMQGTDTLGTLNLQDEINNYHTKRFASGLRFPFLTSIMPGIEGCAGNYAGTAATTSNGGLFNIDYVQLPDNW